MTGDDDAHVATIVVNSNEYSKHGQQYSQVGQQWIQPMATVQAVVVSTVVARQRIEATQSSTVMGDVTEQIQVHANERIQVKDEEITMFSVCAGVGSAQMAIERGGLPVKTIGICETDPDCVEIFKEAFPEIPVYGDMRFVITALEQGDLVLRPTILELTVPCQARSIARVLADWSDTVHPSARLWDLQVKMVQLCSPDYVVIENVPPFRNEKKGIDTLEQFEKLEREICKLGYHVESGILRASLFGDATQRQRYLAIFHSNRATYC